MVYLENVKHVNVLYPQSVATTATASATFDTVGFDHATIYFQAGVASSNVTVLKLQEGTATNSFSNIVAFTGGTATSTAVGFVIPDADTSNGVTVAMSVDLRKRTGRYLKLQAENTDAVTVMSATAILSKAEDTPDTAAERGVDAYIEE